MPAVSSPHQLPQLSSTRLVDHAPPVKRRTQRRKCVLNGIYIIIRLHLLCSSSYRRRMIDEPTAPDLLPVDTIAERWGAAVDAGFVAVPNVLFSAQDKLGLSANDVLVVMNIVMHWWHHDRRPSPRATTIARRSGLGRRTVQRSLKHLEQLGLVERVRVAKDKTEYNLDGLVARLSTYAKDDVWYRPEFRRGASGAELGAGAGLKNPTP